MIFLKEKGTTKSLGKKSKNDKFYTKESIVKELLSLINLKEYNYIIEPSAGNGAFSKNIENCIALDIEPEEDRIIKQDFFSFILNKQKETDKILVIGNPPFGQQAKLAIDFFNYAASFCDTIAFILPKSFKKSSIQNRINLNFHLFFEKDLPENSFLLNGEDYSVPCVFQIWKKQSKERKKIKLPTTSFLFDFTIEVDKADFRVQRVGGNAGKAFIDKNGAKSSNYYLINKSKYTTEELVETINKIEFSGITDTVGPKSLPKGEFILELEEKLKQK